MMVHKATIPLFQVGRKGMCVALFMALLTSMVMLSACSKIGGSVKQEYIDAEFIDVNNTRHPDYNSFVVSQVFFAAYLKGNNAYQYTSDPPFNVNFGAYSLTTNSVPVTIIAAHVHISGRTKTNIIGHFTSTTMNTRVDLDPAVCDDCGHYGSRWLSTDHFLSASPLDNETVTVLIQARVGDAENGVVRDLKFEFLPEVVDIPFFKGLPL